jgi:hypothetical protein
MHSTRSRYRRRFTTLTDLLVSPYNLGFCICSLQVYYRVAVEVGRAIRFFEEE